MDFGKFGHVLVELAVIFSIALVVVRLMGNRTVGQFSPFDFVLMVGIGDIVGNVALDHETNILVGLEALIGLLLLQKILSWSSLKSRVLRKWFEGTPVVLIENGRVLHNNLTKTQFNLDDLRQELHKKGLDFANLPDIKLARLESCGDFSLIRADDMEPMTKRDFKNFITGLTDNPLGLAGLGLIPPGQFAADLKIVADYIRNGPALADAQTKDAGPVREDRH